MSQDGQRRADQVHHTGPVVRPHLEHRGPARRLRAYGDGGSRRLGAGATAARRRRPAPRRSPRAARGAPPGRGRGRPTSHTETPTGRLRVLRPRPRRAHRDPLQREHRGGVGQQTDPVGGDHRHPRAVVVRLDRRPRPPPPAYDAAGIGHRRLDLAGGAAPGGAASGAPGQPRIRPARHVDHALGEAARASASVSASEQRQRLGGRHPVGEQLARSPGRRGRARWRSRRAAGASGPAAR